VFHFNDAFVQIRNTCWYSGLTAALGSFTDHELCRHNLQKLKMEFLSYSRTTNFLHFHHLSLKIIFSNIVKFPLNSGVYCNMVVVYDNWSLHIAYLPQDCHNSKFVIFQEKSLKVWKCYNFLWVQRRPNCAPAASFSNCVMTLYLVKVHLQTFLSVPINKKCQILSCDTLVANEPYGLLFQHKS
jgi:hypothetical protein